MTVVCTNSNSVDKKCVHGERDKLSQPSEFTWNKYTTIVTSLPQYLQHLQIINQVR